MMLSRPCSPTAVIAAFDAAIHAMTVQHHRRPSDRHRNGMDGRLKAGHDG
jgi:hypothetical protein